ncbi:MAG TPA: cupin domain-containing protein [Thermomicrobiales bacterium]|nr:cupin domain-containing protein [Thermomicrobiales bacterium]
MGARIEHEATRVDRSPSGLAIRHLVTGEVGSTDLYTGEQWLERGEQVLLHTHPVEEVLIFTDGSGEATLDGNIVPVAGGVTLHIPAGEVHGFRNTGDGRLHVFVIFPGNTFARTDMIEDGSG